MINKNIFVFFGVIAIISNIVASKDRIAFNKRLRHISYSNSQYKQQTISKMTDELIQILQSDNEKISDVLLFKKLLFIINGLKETFDYAPSHPVYWYSRQG